MDNIISNRKKFVLPAIISGFLPGVGQLIKGHVAKGIAMIIIMSLLTWFVKGWAWAFWFVPWVVNILDALFSQDEEKILK